MENETVKIVQGISGDIINYPPLDELKFVDEDIKKAFAGVSHLQGIPTQVQLNRNIQKLCEILSKTNEPTV